MPRSMKSTKGRLAANMLLQLLFCGLLQTDDALYMVSLLP